MMRANRSFRADLESLEGKALLSVVPVLTQNAYNQVLKQIDRAAGTFAKTQNAVVFDRALAQISYKIPYGHEVLYFDYWLGDEGIYDSAVPGSGVEMVRQLKADLKDYVTTAIADGSIRWR